MTKKGVKFIGDEKRLEKICEDMPIGSEFMELKSFDWSLSGLPLCYAIEPNGYFKLATDQQKTFNGIVKLKKALNLKLLKQNTFVNFTASLFYCDQSKVLSRQLVILNLLGVNKYAPVLDQKVFFLIYCSAIFIGIFSIITLASELTIRLKSKLFYIKFKVIKDFNCKFLVSISIYFAQSKGQLLNRLYLYFRQRPISVFKF